MIHLCQTSYLENLATLFQVTFYSICLYIDDSIFFVLNCIIKLHPKAVNAYNKSVTIVERYDVVVLHPLLFSVSITKCYLLCNFGNIIVYTMFCVYY